MQQASQDQNIKSNHVNGMFKAKPIHTMKGDHGEKMTKRKQHEEQKLQEYEERKKTEELERIQKNEELKRQRLEEHRRKNEEKELEMQKQKMEEEERLRKESENRKIEESKRREKIKREQEKRLELEKTRTQMEKSELKRAPRILKKDSFQAINNSTSNLSMKKSTESNVRTGHVNDKRSFWLRSTENLHARHEMSPGPRRRCLGGKDWIRSETTPEPISRPGSSLGQTVADTGRNVKHTAANWSNLSKSRSSAAVLLQESQNRDPAQLARPRSRNDQSIKLVKSKWAQEERGLSQERRAFDEAQTHQVQDTLSGWGKNNEEGVHSGRNTPNPTRHISEMFADSKIGSETWKKAEKQETAVETNTSTMTSERIRHKSGATPWRTKTPEPGLKILNVSVESPHGSNVHISQNAEAQMASFVNIQQSQQQQVTEKEESLKMEQLQMSSNVQVSQVATSSMASSAMTSTTITKHQQHKEEYAEQSSKYTEQKLMVSHQFEEQEKRGGNDFQKKQDEEKRKIVLEEAQKKEELRNIQDVENQKQKQFEEQEKRRRGELQKKQDEERRKILMEEQQKKEELRKIQEMERQQKIQLEEQEKRKRNEIQKKQEDERRKILAEEERKKEAYRKVQEEQYKAEKKKAQEAFEAKKLADEQKRLEEMQRQEILEREAEHQRAQEEQASAEQLKKLIDEDEQSKGQELGTEEAQKDNKPTQLEIQTQEERQDQLRKAQLEEKKSNQAKIYSIPPHPPKPTQSSAQPQQYLRQFHQIEPRTGVAVQGANRKPHQAVGEISTQVSSHLGGSSQYLQTSTRVRETTPKSPAPPSTPKTSRSDRGKSGTPERSKLVIRAEKTPPPESPVPASCSDLGDSSTSSFTQEIFTKNIQMQNSNSRILSHSSGEISGDQHNEPKQPQLKKKDVNDNKLQNTNQMVSTISDSMHQKSLLTVQNERGDCCTPLPVLSEWLQEDIQKRKRQDGEEEKQPNMKTDEDLILKELEMKQKELEQSQILQKEQKLKQQKMFKEIQNERETLNAYDCEKLNQNEAVKSVNVAESSNLVSSEGFKETIEGAKEEEVMTSNELQINIEEASCDGSDAQNNQTVEIKDSSQEDKLKEELIRAAHGKQMKGKRDKKKTNAYTTEELELIQKKRLEEYRKAQEQKAEIEGGLATETASIHTEHSTQEEVEEYQLQQDLFLKKLKEEKINEQKLLEEAIKGKVRGNIAMFQRASIEQQEKEQKIDKRKPKIIRQEVIAVGRANDDSNEGDDERQTELAMREAKSKELHDVALYRENIAPENLFEDLTDAEERAILEIEKRRQELQEISSSRMKTNWEEVVSPHKSRTIPNPELEGLSKDAIRGTAHAWQERESGIGNAHTYGQRDNAPTRRIGNMFSPSSNQWKMEDDDDEEEEFPAPPTQDEVESLNELSNNLTTAEEDIENLVFGIVDVTHEGEESTETQIVNITEAAAPDSKTEVVPSSSQPIPPPRDSSKEYMRDCMSREETNT